MRSGMKRKRREGRREGSSKILGKARWGVDENKKVRHWEVSERLRGFKKAGRRMEIRRRFPILSEINGRMEEYWILDEIDNRGLGAIREGLGR